MYRQHDAGFKDPSAKTVRSRRVSRREIVTRRKSQIRCRSDKADVWESSRNSFG
jgi:hypothetical protein